MRKTFYMLLAVVMLAGCRSTKQVVYTPDSTTQTTTQTTTTSSTTLQTGGNVTVNAGKKLSSGMQMRMVRNEIIQISVRPLGLFEAGRLLIKGDSIYAIDKMNKRYVAEELNAITGGVPLTVGMLQDAFLGREFDADLGPKFDCDFSRNAQGHITSLNIYHVNYDDVRYTIAGLVAHDVSIATQMRGKDLALDLTYSGISWDGTVKIDTSIPKGYNRVDSKQLFSIFGQ